MIEYIKGEIVELTPARMILECAGIGYELNISLNTYTFYNGKPTGKIYVYEVIREDAHLLFGFAGKDERELFLMLTSVSGVGPNDSDRWLLFCRCQWCCHRRSSGGIGYAWIPEGRFAKGG